MPKLPLTAAKAPIVTPLAAMKLKPIFVDRAAETIRLRSLRPAEVTTEIAAWLADPAIKEGLNAPREAMGLEAFRTYVASFDNLRRSLIAIRERASDRPLGLIFLDVDLRHSLGSAHVVIGESADRSLARVFEAIHVLMVHGFAERKLGKLTFHPLARNRAAVAACRLGFLRQEGELKSHRIDGRTGERLDELVFAITLQEANERLRARRDPGLYEGPGLPRGFMTDLAKAAGWLPPDPMGRARIRTGRRDRSSPCRTRG